MAYSELIKSFSHIREYMRQFYVYGFKTREAFSQKSARSYDNERRRVESWLGEYMRFRQDQSGKSVFLSVDSRQIPRNPLYQAFRAKSFTARDITLHFWILDCLAEGESRTLKELMDGLPQAELDESTVRKKLKEYEQLGLIAAEKQGREMAYRLMEDRMDLSRWREALPFFAEADPLGVVGSFVLDRVQDAPDFFRFKHHYILRALESEILFELLQAICQQRSVRLKRVSHRCGTETEEILTPVCIRISVQEGRSYVLGWDEQNQRAKLCRLDRIHSVKLWKEAADFAQCRKGAAQFARYLWGASAVSWDTLDHLEMTLHVEAGEAYIQTRLEREKRCGSVEKLDEHTLRFTVDVYDALEMLPWIRTFTGRIERLECSNPEVLRRYREDIQTMQAMYGGDEDALS